MAQQQLWYDAPEDAFRSLVDALGGYKRVGVDLWPSLPADRAGQRLAQCLDADRAEKLSLAEVLFLLKRGRAANCHVAIAFLNESADYTPPTPVDPESEVQRLQRDYIAATQQLAKIAARIDTRVTQLRAA